MTTPAIDWAVSAWLERQAILARENPPMLWHVLREGMLRHMVSSPAIMRAQLDKLPQTSWANWRTSRKSSYSGCNATGRSVVAYQAPLSRLAATSRSRRPGSRAMHSSTRAWLVRKLQSGTPAADPPLDAGGPLTLQALEAGDIGVALLFSTDPAITAEHLVVLADDRGLQPAENVVPLVRRDVVARYGPRLLAALDTVSARLTTGSLRALDAQVELRGDNPGSVAWTWLRAQGLISAGVRRSDRERRDGDPAKWHGRPLAGSAADSCY